MTHVAAVWCTDLAVTPRKGAGDEHVNASRNGRNNPKSTSTGSMMGLVRAAAAARRGKKDNLSRRSADAKGEFGPGFRSSAGSRVLSSCCCDAALRLDLEPISSAFCQSVQKRI